MGRPKKEYLIEEIEQLIKRYIDENKHIQQIKANTFSKFVNGLFEAGELDYEYKSSFWRSDTQLGKELINKWNEILKVKNSNQNYETADVVYSTNALIKSLNLKLPSGFITKMQFNEAQAKKYAKKQQDCIRYEAKVKSLDSVIRGLKQDVGVLNKLVFNLVIQYLLLNDGKEYKTLNGTKDVPAPINSILKKSFVDLNDGTFESWMVGEFNERSENTKIVPINNKNAFDDLNF